MLSISFLPWLLLLLGIVISIPVASWVESNRRKKAMEAAAAGSDEEGEIAEGDEVYGDEDEAGFAEEGGFGGDEGIVAEDEFGAAENAGFADFDDDTFK